MTTNYRSICRRVACALLTVACWIYLAGSVLGALSFVIFLFGVIFPAASLFAGSAPIKTFRPALRIPLAVAATLLCATPWFYLRRWVPLPVIATDLILIFLLTGWSAHRGDYGRLFTDLRTPTLRHIHLHLGLFLPILFAFNWAGYQVPRGETIGYYGLFPIDFANLACMVTSVTASPGLPLASAVGTGPLHYHWLHFSLAAGLTTFLGIPLTNGSALVLANYITASLLVVVVGYLTAEALPPHRRRTLGSLATTLVIFAPLSTYAYLGLVRLSHLHWLAIDGRNHLVLSIVNSMPVFGNNTFAVALGALVLCLSSTRTYRPSEETLGADGPAPIEDQAAAPTVGGIVMTLIFLCATVGYSVTLFFPLAATLGIAFLAGLIPRRAVVLVATVVVGTIGMACMYKLNVLSGGSNTRIAIGLDHGTFLHLLLVGMAPLWIWVFASWRATRGWAIYWIALGSCALVPTLLYLSGSGSNSDAFSMKTGSLIIILCAPLVAAGMDRLSADALKVARFKWMRCVAIGLAAIGLLNTLVYTFQFAFYRVAHPHAARLQNLDVNYFNALRFIRSDSAVSQIVTDPQTLDQETFNASVLIAERRVLLPSPTTAVYSDPVAAGSEAQQSDGAFREWERSGYRNSSLSARFAQASDYLVVRGPASLDGNWSRASQFGDYTVYRSLARAY